MKQNSWVNQIFSAKQVKYGGVVRRCVHCVIKYGGGIENLIGEVNRRGYRHHISNGQFMIYCDSPNICLGA